MTLRNSGDATMDNVEKCVYYTLKNLDNSDKLAELFCNHLNYKYNGNSLSMRSWNDQVKNSVQDVNLVAEHNDFQIIHCTTKKLLLSTERPIVNQLLKEHPYCLITFSDSEYHNWNFVNIKWDNEPKNRKLFRRIVIGPDEHLHTGAQRISLLEVKKENVTALDLQNQHDKAFDVEEVTKEFFNTFVDIFHLLRNEIIKKSSILKEKANEEAQILLNRLIFLYFIQKKGWLDGKKDYLYRKFLEYDRIHVNYYQDFLILLFQALSSQYLKLRRYLGEIPFLNGGLFEAAPFNSKFPFNLTISNSVFKIIFDDLLEKYNFTVREDTPLDVEVAIDPEMLGKVFENLICQYEKDKDLRKITGSYYTPREIVHSMCKQSLKEYIFANNTLEKKKIESLFKMNPVEQFDEDDIKKLQETISIQEVKSIKQIIDNIKIIDPAVGSGAFLVGMLHELINLIKLLDIMIDGENFIECENYEYYLKHKIIENCLYGVDIQEQAVRICELRLWLSVVVDYISKSGEYVPPLPNLNYRILCGDSLIEKIFGYNVQLDQFARTDNGRKLIDEIYQEKESYFLTHDILEKNKKELLIIKKQFELTEILIKEKKTWIKQKGIQTVLFSEKGEEKKQKEEKEKELIELDRILYQAMENKKKIQSIINDKISFSSEDIDKFRQNLGTTFIWKIDFAEVFKKKGGFDIIIANPPYLTFSRVTGSEHKNKTSDRIIKEILRKNFPYSAEYKLSTYALFMNLGISLIQERGITCFVIPDSFLLGRYFSKIRKFLLDTCNINRIVLFKEDFWEHGIVGLPVVILLTKNNNEKLRNNHYIETNLVDKIENFSKGIATKYKYEQKYFKTINFNKFRLFFRKSDKEFIERVEKDSIEASEIFEMHVGIRPKIGYKNIYLSEKKDNCWKKGLVHGSEVTRYNINWLGNYINVNPKLLWGGGFDKRVVKQEKLLMRKTGNELIVALDRDGFYHLDVLHAIISKNAGYDLLYIMAILNSELMNKYYRLITLSLDRVLAQTNIETIMQLPIYPASWEKQMEISMKVDEILKILKTNCLEFSKENNVYTILVDIDKVIYDLYGVRQ